MKLAQIARKLTMNNIRNHSAYKIAIVALLLALASVISFLSVTGEQNSPSPDKPTTTQQQAGFTKISQTEYAFQNQNKDFQVAISQQQNSNLNIKVGQKNKYISLTLASLALSPSSTSQQSLNWRLLESILKKAHAASGPDSGTTGSTIEADPNNNQQIIVKKPLPNVELKYYVSSSSLKEEIILKDKNAPSQYTFNLDLQGFRLRRRQNGLWYFYDQEDKNFQKPVFYIPKPFTIDAQGERSEAVEINHLIKGGQEYLEVKVDQNWLNDPQRKYPVVIDPTIESPLEDQEIIANRTETSKTFVNPDKTMTTRIYEEPIHYQSSQGSWQEIDTTIRLSDDSNYTYQMQDSVYKVKVKKYFNEKDFLEITDNNVVYRITADPLYWLNEKDEQELITEPQHVEAYTQGSSVVFENAYGPGLDFRVDLDQAKFDKWLIINDLIALGTGPSENLKTGSKVSLNTPFKISFAEQNIQLFQNGKSLLPLTKKVELLSNCPTCSSIDLIVKGELGFFSISPPFYQENTTKPEVEKKLMNWHLVPLGENQVDFQMDFLVDLNDLQTAHFPIMINADTTYYGETADGWIYGISWLYTDARATSDSCSNSSSTNNVGQKYQYDADEKYQVHRLYFSFDTSGIPDGDTITSALIYLASAGDASVADFDIDVYRYAWSEALCSSQEANYDGAYGGSATLEGTLRNTASGWVAGTYYNMSVDTDGISKTGDTKYSVVSGEDVDGSAPTINEYVIVYMADNSGTTYDPYLEITHSTPSLFRFEGLKMEGLKID